MPEAEPKVNCPAFACSNPPTVRFWVEETLPVGPMEKSETPVDVAISKRFAVWFVVPWRSKVVVPVVSPCIKASAVVVAEAPKPIVCVEVEKRIKKEDEAAPPARPWRTWPSTAEDKLKAVEVAYLVPLKSKRFVIVAVVAEAFVTEIRPASMPVEAVILVEETFVIKADAPRR